MNAPPTPREPATAGSPASGLLADLKAKYDHSVEQEKKHRSEINAMRRQLTLIAKQRKAARKQWLDECNRLVG